jgi:2-methylaconitate cis-trans-isomerase PrpF
LATTGAVGIATACVTPDTVAFNLIGGREPPAVLVLEHPSGRLEVKLDTRDGKMIAGILRTARRLFEGRVFAKPFAQVDCAA